jgi:four helix bundle protein
MSGKVQTHRDLDVYRKAFDAAMSIFEITRDFPKDQRYSLTDQIRRASRSVCANLAEGWRKRCYRAAFIAKVVDAEAEAGETQAWLEFAVQCQYADRDRAAALYHTYHEIIGTLVGMRTHPESWIVGPQARRSPPKG